MTLPAAEASGGDAPRWARPFVAVFLAAFFVCGVAGIEAWPLTGWRLFSRLRTPQQSAWRAMVVDARGRETPLPFARLPAGFHAHVHVLRDLPRLPPRRREAVFRAWADGLQAAGIEVAGLRVYRETWDLRDRRRRRQKTLCYLWRPRTDAATSTARDVAPAVAAPH